MSFEQANCAADYYSGISTETSCQVRLIEPDRSDISCFVADNRLRAPPATQGSYSGLPDNTCDGLLFTFHKFRDRFCLAVVNIASGEETEQVAHYPDVKPREFAGYVGRDAFDDSYRRFESFSLLPARLSCHHHLHLIRLPGRGRRGSVLNSLKD